MVEFVLTAPFLFLVLFATIDAARATYYYTVLTAAGQRAAREIALPSERSSDCIALRVTVENGNGIRIVPDPASSLGNANPAPRAPARFVPAGQPPPNVGYVYLYPAESPPGGQQMSNPPRTCSANPVANPRDLPRTQKNYPYVAVLVRYGFVPWMPLVSTVIPDITLQTVATAVPECPDPKC